MDDFPQKLKKVVRIVLLGPAIGQLDRRKASPYQLLCDKIIKYKIIKHKIIKYRNRGNLPRKKNLNKVTHKSAYSCQVCWTDTTSSCTPMVNYSEGRLLMFLLLKTK